MVDLGVDAGRDMICFPLGYEINRFRSLLWAKPLEVVEAIDNSQR